MLQICCIVELLDELLVSVDLLEVGIELLTLRVFFSLLCLLLFFSNTKFMSSIQSNNLQDYIFFVLLIFHF